jgi:hypothetical protein
MKAAVAVASGWPRFVTPPALDLEQNLRIVQCVLLLALSGLRWRYALPLGWNTWTMLAGYGTFVALNAVTLGARSQLGPAFQESLQSLQPIEYCLTLTVWCVGLWRYAPNPEADGALEYDYVRVSEQTAAALHRVRNHLMQPFRP